MKAGLEESDEDRFGRKQWRQVWKKQALWILDFLSTKGAQNCTETPVSFRSRFQERVRGHKKVYSV